MTHRLVASALGLAPTSTTPPSDATPPTPASGPAGSPRGAGRAHLRSRRRPHAATALILLIGWASSVLGWLITARVIANDDRQLLTQEASQAGLVLQTLMYQQETQLRSLAAQPGVVEGDPAAVAALSTSLQSSGIQGVAVLAPSGGGIRVVASGGRVNAVGPGVQPSAALLAAVQGSGFRPVDVFGNGATRSLGIAVTLGTAGQGRTLYAEYPFPQQETDAGLPGMTMSSVHYAVYTVAETREHAIFTDVTTLPLTGERATVVLASSAEEPAQPVISDGPPSTPAPGGSVILVMAPTGPLAGRLAGDLPWLLLVTGVLSTVLVAGLIEAVLRRRDTALLLVADLKEKNHALDAAAQAERSAEEERRHLESQLRQSQRMEAVGQLAGGVAHDFNNLLAIIISFSGFLRDDLADTPHADDVDQVLKAARRASELTRQLLVFSRRDDVEPELIDPGALLSDLQVILERTLGETIHLGVATANVAPVLCDAGEFEQVIMNLAVNARDAMPDGGRLGVRVYEVVDGQRTPASIAETADAWVVLEVADNGCGMPPEVAARACEPFFTTKEVGKGTGLGLSTVYGIAHRWGGEVVISTAPGTGTTVSVWLPAESANADPVRSATALPAAAPMTRSGTVLVVEDEAGVRAAARRILERAGYDVREAPTARTVLDHARTMTDGVDAVVTDVVMPEGVSGHQLVDELRAMRRRLPVVMMSGYSAEARPRVDEDGLRWVTKPFSDDTLVRAVREAMATAGSVG